MEKYYAFMSAALPWIAMGLLLAVFFVRAASRKKSQEKKEEYGSEGMALGMCFGVALSTALHINVGLGMMAGLVLGMLVGPGIEKKGDNNRGGKENEHLL